MAELTVRVPNAEFRRVVLDAYKDEPFEAIMHLIVDLVEEVAGDVEAAEHLKYLIEVIENYIGEEE